MQSRFSFDRVRLPTIGTQALHGRRHPILRFYDQMIQRFAFAFQIPHLKIPQMSTESISPWRVDMLRRSPGGRPPLEEATWLLTSSDNFQSRTLSECPPMQILAAQDVM